MSNNSPVIYSFFNYFKNRPWLITWLFIFSLAIIILALTGNIHTQGNGKVTVYEWGLILSTIGIWIIANFLFKRDLTEEYLMGIIFGIQWEFLTEPYWTYLPDKFNVLAWKGKDIPLLALMGWGAVFTLAVIFSNFIGKTVFKLHPKQLIFDWRVLICDAIAIQLFGSFAEWLFGIVFHCWDYNLSFGIGKSLLGLGWEVHIGYMIVMFWYGTTFRVWKLKLENDL